MIFLILALGCAKHAPLAPHGHEHPLLGKIWSLADKEFVDEDDVFDALAAADYALLGEKHDNPDHHFLQARAIAAIAPPDSIVAFEQLDRTDPVDGASSAVGLAEAVLWAESDWPDFAIYEPVFTAVYQAKARVVAAHPTAADIEEGIEGLPGRELTEAGTADLTEEIIESHCGHAPENLIEYMLSAQTLKDAYMAQSLGSGGILVAGGGHTRKDRGVPYYLDGTSVNLTFREVDEDNTDPAEYETAERADFVWFTARMDNHDPCEAFRKSLENMGKPKPEDHESEEPEK